MKITNKKSLTTCMHKKHTLTKIWKNWQRSLSNGNKVLYGKC